MDFQFPAYSADSVGCRYADRDGERRYMWRLGVAFSDPSNLGRHETGVFISFKLPDTIPLTDARLDSVLAANPITVDEKWGHTDFLLERTMPTVAWARLEHGGVHVHIEGENAVRELLRPRSDSAFVWACQANPRTKPRAVLIERVSR